MLYDLFQQSPSHIAVIRLLLRQHPRVPDSGIRTSWGTVQRASEMRSF